MLVVNGELVAVAKRVPGHVVGDGEHTIAQLVDIVNSDPRRGIGHEKVLTRLELDDAGRAAAGARRATTADDRACRRARSSSCASTGNLSTGGTAIDLTDVIHPDNREMADARRPGDRARRRRRRLPHRPTSPQSYKDVGGGICEVNAAPGFRMHVAPTEGTPRDVAGPVIDMLFPPGTPARDPDRGDHRHERQDHDRAHARAHP